MFLLHSSLFRLVLAPQCSFVLSNSYESLWFAFIAERLWRYFIFFPLSRGPSWRARHWCHYWCELLWENCTVSSILELNLRLYAASRGATFCFVKLQDGRKLARAYWDLELCVLQVVCHCKLCCIRVCCSCSPCRLVVFVRSSGPPQLQSQCLAHLPCRLCKLLEHIYLYRSSRDW